MTLSQVNHHVIIGVFSGLTTLNLTYFTDWLPDFCVVNAVKHFGVCVCTLLKEVRMVLGSVILLLNGQVKQLACNPFSIISRVYFTIIVLMEWNMYRGLIIFIQTV